MIDSLLSISSFNSLKSSTCNHTTWLIRQITFNDSYLNQYIEIARYDSIQNRFIFNYHKDYLFYINENTGQLTFTNTSDENLLFTEVSLHAESGLSQGDDIIHDIYRFIRLSIRTRKQFLYF